MQAALPAPGSRPAAWPAFYTIFAVALSAFTLAVCDGQTPTYEQRKSLYLESYAKRRLAQGPNPRTWVDVERWCVAHACLTKGVRLDEANQYLSEVQWVSLWRGLVADTDVQVTDLLRTYLEFRDNRRLSANAREHLAGLFGEWRVPNDDRNRDADRKYEWPCEYTENHSLNILVAGYLIDHALDRDRSLRRELLERFLRDRARWGWSEFHSPNYAVVTAKALVCLSDFAPDKTVAEAARMHLDVLAYEFANQGLKHWRGVPFARGARSRGNNRSNSFFELARLWFGDPAKDAKYTGGNFLAHVCTSAYEPPEGAAWLVAHPMERGRYVMTEVATTGPARLRVPITIWVAPSVTMASAQGHGSYYDGCFWSISFASSPGNVITGHYLQGRNILQVRNTMVTFGQVSWHGKLGRKQEGKFAVGDDGEAFVGQIDLGDDCHLLMVGDRTEYADRAAFQRALASLEPRFEEGLVSWKTPTGVKIEMSNVRSGRRWRMVSARENGRPIRLDRNLLYNSPHLRSVRGSMVIEVLDRGKRKVYDFGRPRGPKVLKRRGSSLTALPADEVKGPLGLDFVYVPPGEFPMGSSLTEGRENERPQRWVYVDGFYIAKTEVTAGQYRSYLAANPKAAPPPEWYWKERAKTDDYPMAWVNWAEANAFCQWLSRQDGGSYRLPSEAEWEKAAKGFAHRAYPWGEEYDGTQSGTRNGTYAPVGSKETDVSPFGALDMAGNLWEWCADWFDAKYYGTAPARNPRGPDAGKFRSLRGCGWNFDPDTFRCSYRTRFSPQERSLHIGFRVVREVR